MENEDEREFTFEPLRGTIFLLAIRLFVLLAIFEALYGGIVYFLNLTLNLPFEWHHHLSAALLGLYAVKISVELSFIIYLFLKWAGTNYFITKKHIIKRTGILASHEEVFHFDNIRAITVNQSFIGRVVGYGDIELKISSSGGYQAVLTMFSIDQPYKYEAILKTLF
jgi:uncharacterized membrane protein YdbT with pleckstrin-like domain